MARTVEQIERDLTALEETTIAIAQDFYAAYIQYLQDFGQAVRKQLIQAAYHICTQGYPDRFLKLSLRQRQDLQQSIRQIAQQAQTQLLQSITPFASSPVNSQDNSESINLAADLSLESLTTEASATTPVEESQSPVPGVPTTPQDLVRWQETVEKGVVEILQGLSHTANRFLQRSDVLSNKLPEPILEVAAKTGAETASGPPNLLNLLIEAEGDDEAKVTHIMAIRLRVAEVEFNDPSLAAGRSKLRSLSAHLNQLGREYQKKQREKAIAEAESAWRASWYDE